MHHLKANGASIPALGLGTWQLRGEECASIVARAIEDGYRHIDTAVMYENEQAVGQGIRASGIDRDELFVTTKIWPTELREGTYQDTVRASLDRLGLERVDLLLIHWPPKAGRVSDWAALHNISVQQGWTRHIGVSNFTTGQLDDFCAASDAPVVCNQVENHPYLDQSKIRAACRKHGLALMAYCPLFRGGALFTEAAVEAAARAHGKSPAQIVLRWHVQHDGAGAIPKTATPERLGENIDIFDFSLDDGEMDAITALTKRHERICDFDFSPTWDAA